MKYLFLFCLLYTNINSLEAQKSDFKLKKDVLDYYWKMAVVDEDLIHYPIELKDKKWTTVSNAEYELEAEVDYRKGYIFITDPGKKEEGKPEDKVNTFRFVVYKRKKNAPLIAISKRKYIDGHWVTDVDFWEERGGKWFNIVDDVLPELTYQDFLKGGRTEHEYNQELGKLLPLHYRLPKKGNTIKVFLLSEDLTGYCMNVNPDDENCQIRQFIEYQSVDLNWNKRKSKFSIGNFKN